MKTLIQNSIFVNKIRKGPNAITAFNMIDDSQKNSIKYVDISKVAGTTISVNYSYQENDQTFLDSIYLSVPSGLSELQIKDFVISEIENKLNAL